MKYHLKLCILFIIQRKQEKYKKTLPYRRHFPQVKSISSGQAKEVPAVHRYLPEVIALEIYTVKIQGTQQNTWEEMVQDWLLQALLQEYRETVLTEYP